ncbi:MAG: FUSC family protein [Alphaproteobacteria bacterium]|nr:FUSC family protein [Alphaproteobacteria bacterium]
MKLAEYGREVLDDLAELSGMTFEAVEGFGRELWQLGDDPVRTKQGIVAACSVMLATTLALALEVQSPWWAAISGFMSLMSTGSGSLRRGTLRLVGTIAGACVGFVMARWLPYEHMLLLLFIGGMTMLGVIAMQVSPHGLAWLFLSITSTMVLLSNLADPLQAVDTAYFRTFEVAIGVASAIIVANLMQDWHAEPPPTAPGWRHLLDAQWPAVLHGLRSAIAVNVVLVAWVMLDLVEVDGMALTITMVMAAPVATSGGLGTRQAVAQRALHRFLGCLFGGIVALLVLALGITSFPWWLAFIGAGVWAGTCLQMSTRGLGYLGTQAAFVFVVTLVQGARPPDSIMPGIDRFVGIACGLGILLIVSLLLWPTDREIEEERRIVQGE